MYLNGIYNCISCYSKMFWFPVKDADVSRTQWVCHVIHIVFGTSLGNVRQILGRETFFALLHSWAAPKKPILNRVSTPTFYFFNRLFFLSYESYWYEITFVPILFDCNTFFKTFQSLNLSYFSFLLYGILKITFHFWSPLRMNYKNIFNNFDYCVVVFDIVQCCEEIF